MATISSLGIGSGLDLSGLLDQLNSAERLKLEPITARKTVEQTKLSAYGKLKSALSSLQTAAKALADTKTFQGVTSSITGTGVTAAAQPSAVPGSYTVQVTQLAKAQSLATPVGMVVDPAADLGGGSLTINGGAAIALAAGASSLNDVRDAINAQGGGVTASIVNGGGSDGYRLVLSSTTTGTASEVTVASDGALASLFGYDSATHTGVMAQTVAASDAKLNVNGIDVVSQSNLVADAVQGVTLSLSEAGASHVLTVERDSKAISAAVTGFVDAYNSLQGTISSLTSYNADTKVAGVLLGDATLRGVQGKLRSVLTSDLAEGALVRLSDVGISLQEGGTLAVSSTKLDGLIGSDVSALSDFFSGSVAATGSGLADALDSVLGGILEEGAALDGAAVAGKARITALDKSYERMEESISATIERYRLQFSQLDLLVSQMNSTSSYLSQQFDALSAQLKD